MDAIMCPSQVGRVDSSTTGSFFFKMNFRSKWCSHKYDETVLHTRYLVSIVDADDLVLKHQGISIHNADQHLIIPQEFTAVKELISPAAHQLSSITSNQSCG